MSSRSLSVMSLIAETIAVPATISGRPDPARSDRRYCSRDAVYDILMLYQPQHKRVFKEKNEERFLLE